MVSQGQHKPPQRCYHSPVRGNRLVEEGVAEQRHDRVCLGAQHQVLTVTPQSILINSPRSSCTGQNITSYLRHGAVREGVLHVVREHAAAMRNHLCTGQHEAVSNVCPQQTGVSWSHEAYGYVKCSAESHDSAALRQPAHPCHIRLQDVSTLALQQLPFQTHTCWV